MTAPRPPGVSHAELTPLGRAFACARTQAASCVPAAAGSRGAPLPARASTPIMANNDDAQLEARYAVLLETLEGDQRELLVKSMEAPDQTLRKVIQLHEDELEELEQV